MKTVWVFNHFAVPRGAAGGTRHDELFSKLDDWRSFIIASRLNHATGEATPDSDGFIFVPTTPYKGNGLSRIANWASYASSATVKALLSGLPRPDVVYGSSPHLLAGLAADVISRRYRAPLILEVRDLWPKVLADMGSLSEESHLYRILTGIEEYLYRRAQAIVVMAHGTKDELVRRGVEPEKLIFIPNAADPADFEVDATRDDLRAAYGLNRFTFIYTGAHGPANGLDLLVRAALDCPEADVLLVGNGPSKQDLQSLAQTSGATNVRFIDPVPKQEIPQLLKAADAGIHCLADVDLFKYGVSPNKVFDYQAAGLPVITNTPGEVSQLVERAGSGITTGPDGLAAAMADMLRAAPQTLSRWGSAGRDFMETHQSRSAMAARLQALLDHQAPSSVT